MELYHISEISILPPPPLAKSRHSGLYNFSRVCRVSVLCWIWYLLLNLYWNKWCKTVFLCLLYRLNYLVERQSVLLTIKTYTIKQLWKNSRKVRFLGSISLLFLLLQKARINTVLKKKRKAFLRLKKTRFCTFEGN